MLHQLPQKFTRGLHQFCLGRFAWYNTWHSLHFHEHVHWGLLILFLFGFVFGTLLQVYLFPPK